MTLDVVGGGVATAGEELAGRASVTVSGYTTARGTHDAGYTRYSAGVVDVGNRFMNAGKLRLTTKVLGKAFLVMDAGYIPNDSLKETEGHSKTYRGVYILVKEGGILGATLKGAAVGGTAGCSATVALFGVGCFAGGRVGAAGMGFAANRAADHVTDIGWRLLVDTLGGGTQYGLK